ncbi:MAG: hypothetical protein QOD87_2264, partial [Pseudonocardiales bacterium]|nr:hypothetical protein [Pseudonocardiales bacterium]
SSSGPAGTACQRDAREALRPPDVLCRTTPDSLTKPEQPNEGLTTPVKPSFVVSGYPADDRTSEGRVVLRGLGLDILVVGDQVVSRPTIAKGIDQAGEFVRLDQDIASL